MYSRNKVELIGRVGKKPIINTTERGKFANFSLATTQSWNDKTSGERKERTEWHTIAVTNDALASLVEKYVDVGSYLFVEGTLNHNKFTDKEGVEQTRWRVTVDMRGNIGFLTSKKEGTAGHEEDDSGESQTIGDDLPY